MSAKNFLKSASKDDSGFIVHNIKSEYQAEIVQIKTLLPDNFQKTKKYKVLFILPVEPYDQKIYGDALLEAKNLNINNKYGGIICAHPTFSALPWYADHPTNPKIRQESHFIKTVIPFIEENYPVIKKREGRFLLGFSKSGWGAFSLLMRNPELFNKAAAWDSPLCEENIGNYGNSDIFGDEKNFDKYKISALVSQKADFLKEKKRLILMGYGNFEWHVKRMREILIKSEIPHDYDSGCKREHKWNSGWMESSVKFLFSIE